ncbi:MAG TPA: YggS family pyridoxal phosphate-dependent enzyme [Gammaproteobacteria bacterium]|nr:YggS family pyridoxal phosphate-dependent enzyme [Gammaproteobacteria bacterium]
MTSTSVVSDYQVVLDRIRLATQQVGRKPASVRLLAVSKTHTAAAVARLYALGQRAFGENYLQDALPKITELIDLELEWHFIGHIQSNKTREIAKYFHWAHSVDRFKIASRLSQQRPSGMDPLNICLQINLDHESGKSGLDSTQLIALAQRLQPLSGVRLRGIMVIPKPRKGFEQQLGGFQRAQVLFHRLQRELPGIDTLSMGMSGDLEAAIAAGSTLVRVGTAIFGQRSLKMRSTIDV